MNSNTKNNKQLLSNVINHKNNSSNNSRETKIHVILLSIIFFVLVLLIIYNSWIEAKCFLLERSITTGRVLGKHEEEEWCRCDRTCQSPSQSSSASSSSLKNHNEPEKKSVALTIHKQLNKAEFDAHERKVFEDFPDTFSSSSSATSKLFPLMPIKHRVLYRAGFRGTYMKNKHNILRQRIYPLNLDDVSVADHTPVYDIPRAQKTYCELALLHSDLCRDFESAGRCILRIGAKKLELSLPIRCSKSDWFQKNFILKTNNNNNSTKTSQKELSSSTSSALDEDNLVISSGVIFDSQRRAKNPPTYITKGERPYPKIPQPGKWDWNCVKCIVHRLPMAIPEEAIAEKVERNKLFDFNPMSPSYFPFYLSKKQGYSLGRQDEVINRELQSRSFFSWTHRRGCWSAQRHLDILAAGSVPFFPDLLLCKDPNECLPGYPVELVKRALNLPGVNWMVRPDYRPERRFTDPSFKTEKYKYDEFPAHHFISWAEGYSSHPVYNIKRPGIIDHTKFNITEYFLLAEELLDYTKKHLTTKALASYFLRRMGMENAKRVFGTSHWWLPNSVGLVHGLISLGVEVVINSDHGFPSGEFNSTEEELAKLRRQHFFPGYRGAGHLYGMRTDGRLLKQCGRDVNCTQMILDKKFDLFFYCISGDLNKAMFYEELVRNSTPPDRIAFIDGLDQGSTFCHYWWKDMCRRGHILFSREAYQLQEYVPRGRTEAEVRREPEFPQGLDLSKMV